MKIPCNKRRIIVFEYKYKIPKTELSTTYGSITIKNIVFDPSELEKVLPEIIFDDESLKLMFAEECLNDFNRRNIYRRFIPKFENEKELEEFIDKSVQENKTFYSFLAEGLLGLIFNDIYKYKLAKGVIDINDTLNDTHTGVDACMYNTEEQIIVLGEAKFYQKLNEGIERIIKDFIEKNISNKLESLQRGIQNCDESNRIVIKNLSLNEYDEITIEQFMQQKIIFAGFVLHSATDISQYNKKEFYDNYNISSELLYKNICKALKSDAIKCNYEIIIIHLPIKDKKELIAKIIETSRKKLDIMKGNI